MVGDVKENYEIPGIKKSTWAQYETQRDVLQSYRRGKYNCPLKQTLFHSSNPENSEVSINVVRLKTWAVHKVK